MTLRNRPRSWEDHHFVPTIYPCACGEFLQQASGTTFLACGECGEVRWLV